MGARGLLVVEDADGVRTWGEVFAIVAGAEFEVWRGGIQ